MVDTGFEWVVQPCGRDNLQETLNKLQANEVEVWNVFEHVVESTSYRAETILFTVVGLRRVLKKKMTVDLIECLEFAVHQTESQIKGDTVLSEDGREWLDRSTAVLKSVREDLIP